MCFKWILIPKLNSNFFQFEINTYKTKFNGDTKNEIYEMIMERWYYFEIFHKYWNEYVIVYKKQ